MADDKDKILKTLSGLPGVGEQRAKMLYDSGIRSPTDIVEMGLSGLAGIPQIGFSTAKKILNGAREKVDSVETEDETELEAQGSSGESGMVDEELDLEELEAEVDIEPEEEDDDDAFAALSELESSLQDDDDIEPEEEDDDDAFAALSDLESSLQDDDDIEPEEEDDDDAFAALSDLESSLDDDDVEPEEEDDDDAFAALSDLESSLDDDDVEPEEEDDDDAFAALSDLESSLDDDDDIEQEEEDFDDAYDSIDELQSSMDDDDDEVMGELGIDDFSDDDTFVDIGLESDLEDILHSIEEDDEIMPDMDAAREIDKWLEEKVGIEEHIGEESVCPVCGDIVSIYERLCDTCGVEFALSDVKCGYCAAIIDAEDMKCPQCSMSLVDEKTVCPICDSVVYASEQICPYCGAEFHEDNVRCSECKGTVPIDAVMCPHCETILRERIIEEVMASRGGAMKVSSESTQVDIGGIQLQVTPPSVQGSDKSSSTSMGGSSRTKTKAGRILFPFCAIVNQEKMKRALILNAVNTEIGGLLIEGQRGTAKSVAVRGLAEILPPIEVVSGCRFSCDPHMPERWCWECIEKYGEGGEIPVEFRPVKVIDLPLNATEDRVVGTLDVEKILTEGVKSFDEGILADVNRGILYVDEINLLDDYIVDVLLDAAAMGVVTVEREEISLSYPSKFIIVGSMNPEEGALRPQLLDRLALNVKVVGIPDAKERVEIIYRNEAFLKDPFKFREKYYDEQDELGQKIIDARERLEEITITPEMDNVIAKLAVDFEVDGHRADIIMKRSSITNAAFEGRTEVNIDDVMLAAEMALPHRMRKGPLESAEFSSERLKRLVRGYSV